MTTPALSPTSFTLLDLPPAGLVTEKHAARLLGFHPSFLRNCRRMEGRYRGRLPGPVYFRFGRVIKYRVADLTAWIEAHRIQPAEAAAVARVEDRAASEA